MIRDVIDSFKKTTPAANQAFVLKSQNERNTCHSGSYSKVYSYSKNWCERNDMLIIFQTNSQNFCAFKDLKIYKYLLKYFKQGRFDFLLQINKLFNELKKFKLRTGQKPEHKPVSK